TSLSEGFPYPLLEAMYQGRPTVSYDFDFGPREAIEHGGSGYIIPLGDVDELAERLGELAADPALREQFGARARERYDERFAPAAVAEQYRDFLGPHDAPIDLTEVFATDGVEPIAAWEIGHRVRRSGLRRVHEVTVDSSVQLYDIEVDDGETITHPQVRREDGRTVIEFTAGGCSVGACGVPPGRPAPPATGSSPPAAGHGTTPGTPRRARPSSSAARRPRPSPGRCGRSCPRRSLVEPRSAAPPRRSPPHPRR